MSRVARISPFAGVLVAVLALAACDTPEGTPDKVTRLAPPQAGVVYRGVDTRLLDGDLVQFLVEVGPGPDQPAERADIERYAECAAAQYTLIRGYGFARHVRTNVTPTGNGGWQGDAVYTVSAALPRGLKTIDAEVVASNCAENEIPMV